VAVAIAAAPLLADVAVTSGVGGSAGAGAAAIATAVMVAGAIVAVAGRLLQAKPSATMNRRRLVARRSTGKNRRSFIATPRVSDPGAIEWSGARPMVNAGPSEDHPPLAR
jgi:hypothetical protein